MATRWLPIDEQLEKTLQHSDVALLTRVKELKEEKLAATEVEKISEFKVYQRQRSKKVSTSISVSPFFKGDGSYDDFTYVYFAGAFSDKYRITQGSGSSIIAERFGLGIEIELKISNIKTALKGGFASIGAAIDMGLATAEYSYHILSLPPGEFQSLLPPVGQFDGNAIDNFRKLVEKLKELYQSSIHTMDLVAIEVLMADAMAEEGTENARSYYFAARRIIEGKSLKDAVSNARTASRQYNEDAIQYMYSRAGLTSIEEKPSLQSISLAKNFINE
ncbi:MAG TPA: hypothetical protein VGN63_18820 [Flavisolibacter sp.]|jgi:hypothetical protein|nr:hypothetical protein [Flavisolibacter sp.]